MTASRTPTEVDTVAESYVEQWAALDPFVATELGIAGHDGEVPDLSPDGLAAVSALRQRTLIALSAARPVDAQDRITVAALREALTVEEELRAAGTEEANVRNIASPVQSARDNFDLLPTASAEDWAAIASRMRGLPDALAGYTASLRLAATRGDVSARRQVEAGATQSARNHGPSGYFATLAASAPGDLPAGLRADLDAAARAAGDAYGALAEFLRTELLDQAPEVDAVGREKYALHSRSFLGSSVDLEETYEWGQEELARLGAAMRETAERIQPGATVREVMDQLDKDPERRVPSREALLEWMQATSDAAVAALADTHFDIPEPVRTLECRIATAGTGVIYYTGPSEDFSRPGRMWWDVPDGDDEFSTWRELTTVYHEGVPGHHLQVGQTIVRAELLNRWRRVASWVSGHGEGWALYAERLMADLGFLDDPAEYLGMLDGQSTRAARVVLDIGIHCGFDAPAEAGGGPWTYEKAWEFFGAHCAMTESVRRFELERYLGWPGQAPSYKVGERLWLQLRDEARRQQGDAFDLKAFHRSALDVGSVGLDVLRAAVLGEYD